MKHRHARPIAALLLAALLWPTAGCVQRAADGADAESAKKDQKAEEEAPILVRTARVGTGDLSRGLRATTTLESERHAALSLQVGGLVAEVAVDVGEPVKAGQLLCRIDDEQPKLALREAELAAKEARERADESTLAAQEATHRLANTKLEHEEAVAAHERQKGLLGDDVATRTEVETAYYAAERAALSVKNAELAVQKAKLAATIAATTADKAQLALERARLDHASCRLAAPFDGVIARREVRAGERVNAGQVVFEIADPTRLRAPVYLPQKNLAVLDEGLQIEIVADAGSGLVGRGSVIRVPTTVDPATGNVRLDVRVEEAAGFLPGMFVSLRIVTEKRTGVPVIPKKAMRLDGAGALVYRVDEDDVAHEVRFAPGLEDLENVEVTGGAITVGDRIVLIGVDQLTDGAKVQEAGQAPSPAAIAAEPTESQQPPAAEGTH